MWSRSNSITDGATAQELGDELVGKALARKRDVGVLEDVGHAPDAVVVLDEPVLLP